MRLQLTMEQVAGITTEQKKTSQMSSIDQKDEEWKVLPANPFVMARAAWQENSNHLGLDQIDIDRWLFAKVQRALPNNEVSTHPASIESSGAVHQTRTMKTVETLPRLIHCYYQ